MSVSDNTAMSVSDNFARFPLDIKKSGVGGFRLCYLETISGYCFCCLND